MTLYRWDGKLLVRNGALAIHERCCCEEPCYCPDCDVCPYCCLEWSNWLVAWDGCICPYLTFVYEYAGTPEEEACWENNTPSTNCSPIGGRKGPYWVSNCKWEIPGYWNCLIDDGAGGTALGFAGCGVLVVELKNSTTIELSIKSGTGPTGCHDAGGELADNNCDDAINDVITIDITTIDNGPEATICTTSRTPKSSLGGGLSSAPNGCVSEVQFDYTQEECCPDTHPYACDPADEGEPP
jgi:hypothetical protein